MISEACAACGVTSSIVRNRIKTNADFREAYELALEDSTDILEATARRRAVDGWEEPVVHQGQLTPVWERDDEGQVVLVAAPDGEMRPRQARNADGTLQWLTVRKHSDALLALLLKGRRKELGERTEITGAGGSPITDLSETERAARAAALLAAAAARRDVDSIA